MFEFGSQLTRQPWELLPTKGLENNQVNILPDSGDVSESSSKSTKCKMVSVARAKSKKNKAVNEKVDMGNRPSKKLQMVIYPIYFMS